MAPKGPYKLVTVNNAPDRAKIIVGRVVEAMKEEYTIVYEANAESELNIVKSIPAMMLTITGPEAAKELFEKFMPDVVVSTSSYLLTE